MAPPKSEFEKQMIHLEAEIRRLEAEFNMFFAGRLPRPPWETRARVAALVKKHDQSFIRITREGAPNLFIFKHDIKYIQEES